MPQRRRARTTETSAPPPHHRHPRRCHRRRVPRTPGRGDLGGLATLFEPDVSFDALLPDGLRSGRASRARAFVGWFGRVDELELVAASVDHVGPRLQLQWRARVRGGPFGEASHVVEQQVYADPGPSGRIARLTMLCSGFVREQPDAGL